MGRAGPRAPCLPGQRGGVRRDRRPHNGARAGLLGRPVPSPAERDQHQRRRPQRVLGRPEREHPGDHHPALRQRPRPASHSGGGRPIGSHISTTLTRAPAATLRDQNVGAEVVDVKEFELAIGHLRMPETD